ncbi:bifunctional serine/threonine-protein kinase/formylglycine-generating enzyme family protein [Candidatus Riflebacteria bacterium]
MSEPPEETIVEKTAGETIKFENDNFQDFLTEQWGSEVNFPERYQVVAPIGKGGMGQVFEVFDQVLERSCAIKVIKQEHVAEEDVLLRFQTEAKITAGINHPNIIKIFDFSKDPKNPFFVMEKFQGLNGREFLQKEKVNIRRLIPLFKQIIQGLNAAWKSELIHRDIKPANILIDAEDNLKIIDFGLGKPLKMGKVSNLTKTGTILGSPLFMSPEQCEDSTNLTFKTDIYSAGATFYYFLTGKPPFQAESISKIFIMHCRDPRPRVIEKLKGCPDSLSRLVERMMAIDKKQRPDYNEILNSLKELEEELVFKEKSRDLAKKARQKGKQSHVMPAEATVEIRKKKVEPLTKPGITPADKSAQVESQGANKYLIAGVFLLLLFVLLFFFNPFKTRSSKDKLTVKVETDLQEVRVNSIGMKLRLVKPGDFLMGGSFDNPFTEDDEKPQHPVSISRPFFMGVHEVTQGQYEKVMGEKPSYFSNAGKNAPVEEVSWLEAKEFCKKLTAIDKTAGFLQEGHFYRLPFEAEWEYVCRAGTRTPVYSGKLRQEKAKNWQMLDSISWYRGNSGVTYKDGYDSSDWKEMQYPSKTVGTHPVGKKRPNPWGFFDMIGNVWEWCEDRYETHYYEKSVKKDPKGPQKSSNKMRVLRGGAWDSDVDFCHSAARIGQNSTEEKNNYSGFRVVLVW